MLACAGMGLDTLYPMTERRAEHVVSRMDVGISRDFAWTAEDVVSGSDGEWLHITWPLRHVRFLLNFNVERSQGREWASRC